MRAQSVARVLAVGAEARAPGALVPAGPTLRRIEWLLKEGFTQTALARMLGSKAKQPTLQIGRDRVEAGTAAKVEAAAGTMPQAPDGSKRGEAGMNKALMLKNRRQNRAAPGTIRPVGLRRRPSREVGGEPVCKTPSCIGGWAAVLSGRGNTFHTAKDPSRRIRQEARSALDLTQAKAGRLFDEAWPAWWLEKAGIDIGSDPVEAWRKAACAGQVRFESEAIRHLNARTRARAAWRT